MSKIKKISKNSKGITLVALVITIIIIIILATVAISFAFGNNGLITRAEDASGMYANDTAYTEGSITNVEAYINDMLIGNGGDPEEPEEPEEPAEPTTIEETLKEGDYVYYTDGTGTQRACVVLYGPENTNYANYGIQIITMDTVEDVTIGVPNDISASRTAYNEGISTVNNATSKYLNTTYASSVRSVGTVPDNPTYDGAGYFTINPDDNTDGFFTSYNGTFRDADENYLTDWNQMNALTIHSINEEYWLAARQIDAEFGVCYFRVRYVRTNGRFGANDQVCITYRDTDTYADQVIAGIRPVFTLNAGLKVTGGSGTSEEPYTLGV